MDAGESSLGVGHPIGSDVAVGSTQGQRRSGRDAAKALLVSAKILEDLGDHETATAEGNHGERVLFPSSIGLPDP